MLLCGNTIIVTGGAQGLGEGIVSVCHREGANVVIADIDYGRAAELAQRLGLRSLAIPCDIRRQDEIRQLVDETVDCFGQIHGLVNNAGINFVKPFLETTPQDWDMVLDTDLKATFFLTQLVCHHMLLQNPSRGSIVNISSVHSYAALPLSAPYDAAKCGVVGMSKSIAVEMARDGIRVNCISPGLLDTKIWQDILASSAEPQACATHWNNNIPISRVIQPEEIGELAAFLLSDRSTCITGANVFADGGMTSQLVSRD